METEQFYITLPSNIEKDSTPSNFRVKLPGKILLESDNWVVGLAEIIYPFSWHNVTEEENQFYIEMEMTPGNKYFHKVQIVPTYYASVEEVVLSIESALHPLRTVYNLTKAHFNIDYMPRNELIIVHLDPKVIKHVSFTEKLTEILGFEDRVLYNFRKGQHKPFEKYATKIPEIRNNVQTMYIYCDVVSQQIVGNVLAPLLRIIDVQGSYKNTVNRTYDNPHYVSVQLKDIDAIEINIKDCFDNFIQFNSGTVVVKLHFKWRSVYYSD